VVDCYVGLVSLVVELVKVFTVWTLPLLPQSFPKHLTCRFVPDWPPVPSTAQVPKCAAYPVCPFVPPSVVKTVILQLLTRVFDLFALPALVEEVINSIGEKELPLIMNTGASCCISPCQSDFVTYSKSQVKIKDLSSSNSVAGEGMIRWKVLDAHGRSVTIDIPGYHVPHASV
jgi:hypothetical protein